MIGFLKVSAGVAFLMTIVIVPVLVVSGLFLYLAANNSHATKANENYITLTEYSEFVDGASGVKSDRLIACDKDRGLCQEVIDATKNCFSQSGERILVTGYFKGHVRSFVYSDCPGFRSLEGIVRSQSV